MPEEVLQKEFLSCVPIEFAVKRPVPVSSEKTVPRNRVGSHVWLRCTCCGSGYVFAYEQDLRAVNGVVLATDVTELTTVKLMLAGEQTTKFGDAFTYDTPLTWFRSHVAGKRHRIKHAVTTAFYNEALGFLEGKSARHHEVAWRSGSSTPFG